MNAVAERIQQHLIDPEICIRCNTCEETCPQDAITHDSRNYVVDATACNACNACIAPCPTGAIDNWRQVAQAQAYTLEEQLSWDELPAPVAADPDDTSKLPEEVSRLEAEVVLGQGGSAVAPWSAAKPSINLFGVRAPAIATVSGNFRLTGPDASTDVRHIVLDFGNAAFPVLEGQSIGILPPGTDAGGKPHYLRLYSVASARDGERPGHNNVALTVKRVTVDHEGRPTAGVASNYLCDLAKGDTVQVVGPYGTTYLMPNHPGSNLLMICTGTGSAPMRAMTEWRRRHQGTGETGRLMLFFGTRSADELPYHGPLLKLPSAFIDVNLAFSRATDQPRRYVQDAIRARAADVAPLLADAETHIYICGLKGMEAGVDSAFADVCRDHGIDWNTLRPAMLAKGRYHVETY